MKGTRLVVTEGPLAGSEIPLEGNQITLGRAPDSTLVIDDDYASSRHARIYEAEGAWVVEDLGSTPQTPPAWEEVIYGTWSPERVLPWQHLEGPLLISTLAKHQHEALGQG